MVAGPARVIPRPSERSGVASRRNGSNSIDLRDPRGRSALGPSRRSNRSAEFARDTTLRASSLTIGAVACLASGFGYGFLGISGRAETTFGILFAPLLGLLGYLLISRWLVPRIGDAIAAVVFAGLGVRLLASIPRFLSGADAPIYQREGVRIAAELRRFNFGVDTGRQVPGTGTVRYLSGMVNVLTGSSYVATFLLFAVVALVGQAFFLLGLHRALSPRQFRLLAIAVMASPTLAYWPSSIGKESLSLLGIGFGTYGASLVYEQHWRGLWWVVAGTGAVGLVRPHVAMILLAGLFVGLMAFKAHSRGRMATHLALLATVIVGAMLMANASADLFGLESFDGASDLNAALDFAQERTSQDQSQFVAARVTSPLDFPGAAVTVLFRPFPWEADSLAAMVSSAESMALILLLFAALPGLVRSANYVVQRGQMLYALAFTSVFVYVFSAIGNFGILSRQRAQVVPFILLFVAFGLGATHERLKRTSVSKGRR